MLKIMAVAALLGGCDARWDLPASITPKAEPSALAEWSVYVEEQMDVWNNVLMERGCDPPFHLGDEGYSVILVPRDKWTADGYVGFQHYDSIEVCGPSVGVVPKSGTLLHELGHALGLEHVSGRPSLMNPIPQKELMPGDVDYAAEILGCPLD